MSVVKITTPIDEATIRSLHVGDSAAITGRLCTGRDAVHHRVHEGVKPPVDLEGQIIDHCGPVMLKEGDQWICKAAGPTTSSREEPYEHEVIRDYKIRGVVGKGEWARRRSPRAKNMELSICMRSAAPRRSAPHRSSASTPSIGS